MPDFVQQFEAPITGRDGEVYIAFVRGEIRPDRRWEARIAFRRLIDGATFSTATETTQPDWQAILYWATGLGAAYFQGALDRAMSPRPRNPDAARLRPLVERGIDTSGLAERRAEIMRSILAYFRNRRSPQVLTDELFGHLPFANADVVRALESLEQRERLLVRRTDQGNDWLLLTEEGLRATGLDALPHRHNEPVIDRRKPRR